jgi:amino acid adenylation domain-containing protein
MGLRSAEVYVGILAALIAGFGVVPLNPTFPAWRLKTMIDSAELSILVLDNKGAAAIDGLAALFDRPMTLVTERSQPGELQRRLALHSFQAADQDTSEPASEFPPAQPDDWAYLFFTSGSTGVPKGVGVLHRNAVRFVEMTLSRYEHLGLSENDRFSQFYELSFDSSMFDLYICWALGACLCCPSASEWMNPTKYILEKQLTVIDIVPSTGHFMNRNRGLKAGRFPLLRLSRFGGEALSAELGAAFAAAAPNALVDNAYGPTEATVDACHYSWDTQRSPSECHHGMVPIGYPAPGVEVLIVDDHLSEVPELGEGELLLSGPQLTPGYWRNEEKTSQAFISVPGRKERFYRTGDLVKRPRPGEPIIYLGRIDHQIKIFGVRIELGEVEMALREAARTDTAVALGWPVTSSGASGIAAFVSKTSVTPEEIKNRLAKKLPGVMVPRRLEIVDALPLNINGKVDRKALLERLQATASDPSSRA